jgi:hypothetical protein
MRIGAARVQRAHRARKFTDLEEEFDREALEPGAVDAALRDPTPQRVSAEAAARLDQLAQRVGERAGSQRSGIGHAAQWGVRPARAELDGNARECATPTPLAQPERDPVHWSGELGRGS